MTKTLLSILGSLILLVSACGSKENSIPYLLPQKITKTPSQVENQALNMLGILDKKFTSSEVADSLSSRAIRQEIKGFNIDFIQTSKEQVNMSVAITYGESAGQCSRIDYSVQKFNLSDLNKGWSKIDNLGQVRCMNNCKYLVFIIENSPSAIASADGKAVAAAVPVIMENRSADLSNAQFLPTTSEDDLFLRFDNQDSNYCIKPALLIQATEVAIPISPLDNNDPDYNYFDFGNNNSFF